MVSVLSLFVVRLSVVPEKFGVGNFAFGGDDSLLSSVLLKHMTADPFFT